MINALKFFYKFTGLLLIKKLLLRSFYRVVYKTKNNKHEIITFKDFNNEVFFGYYDISPFSANNKIILSLSLNKNKKDSSIDVGFFNVNNPKIFNKVGISETWCWQQGCRLRWSKKDNDNIIYNKLVDDNYGSVIQNIHSKKILKNLNRPIYDLNFQENYALSLNFSRLHRLRPGYGYKNFVDNNIRENSPKDDGVFIIDIHNNSSKLILSLDYLSKLKPRKSMIGAQHYINHLSWSPSGKRFLFFHLWTKSNSRYSRLLTSDLKGEDLFILENSENVSHYDWINNSEIIITTHSKTNGLRYRIYYDKSEKKVDLSKSLNEDGHPSFNPINKNVFVSDTYPNKFGDRELFLYDIKSNVKSSLVNIYSSIKYRSDYRCDLHPRWSNDAKFISFDSTHLGKRTTNVISVLDEKNN